MYIKNLTNNKKITRPLSAIQNEINTLDTCTHYKKKYLKTRRGN